MLSTLTDTHVRAGADSTIVIDCSDVTLYHLESDGTVCEAGPLSATAGGLPGPVTAMLQVIAALGAVS